MNKYGEHMRVSPEFKRAILSLKLDMFEKNGRRFSDVELTRMIAPRLNTKGIVLDWRLGWK